MADYVTLMGAEDVSRAAGRMQSAADDMKRAAGEIDAAMERHRRWADDWLDRLQIALENHTTGATRS
jgi:hypothetical protein